MKHLPRMTGIVGPFAGLTVVVFVAGISILELYRLSPPVTQGTLRKLKVGMTTNDVLEILGTPGRVAGHKWLYGGQRYQLLHVRFDQGWHLEECWIDD